ncbi:type I polyketide synthase [Trinickia sp. NRRL B-1857]|uniref:type I polyketide synthase n=1 Tax=Trinickia sp. NRRL B-1857 TaxID=3162879 RepID=UPI003D28B9FA
MTTTQQRIAQALKLARERVEALERAQRQPLAIVGIGCRFPHDVAGPDAFWDVLSNGRDVTTEIPADRWDVEHFFDPDPEAPGKMYVRRGGFLDAVDGFDPAFFGISEREAVSLDPQQRLLLEVGWEALEHAGIAPSAVRGASCGVFMGVSWHDYERLAFGRDPRRVDAYAGLGNTPSIAAGRLAYVLGVEGPTMLVDTACSASLVAVHEACQSLRMGECDMALAGGVALMLSALSTVFCCKIRALSPTGRCHTFDAAADGYLRGEGAGVIVLKRLDDARANGDRILAVIRGTAINHDGASSGLTVPNGRAQERLLEAALKDAGVEADAIGYVEAHGTGTPLGDPIELAALSKVYGRGRAAQRPLLVGSVKTNIGHLEAAAGIAGLIKSVLMLQHQQVPASLNFTNPNPRFDWTGSGLAVPTRLTENDVPLKMIGVSSFGFSGTNAHAILESAPEVTREAAVAGRGAQVLTLSARSEEALRALSTRYASFVEQGSADLASICYTANTGRSAFEQRAAWVVRDRAELASRLRAFGEGGEQPALLRGVYRNRRPRVAMLFTGQGSQYAGMGRELYEREPVFRAALDECASLLESELEVGLLEVLYGASTALLDRTDYTQPALFALGYALRRTWESWGVTPQVVMGHSLGEYMAAQAACVLTLEAGLKLVASRGRLMMSRCEGGAMLSVMLEEAPLRERLAKQGVALVLAALNGPSQQVVAGPLAQIEALRAQLAQEGVRTELLPGSHAFHSPLVEPMLEAYEQVLKATPLSAPQLSLVSNVSGAVAGAEVATAGYWVEHTRAPVRFGVGIEALAEQGVDVVLEIGARPTLTVLARQTLAPDSEVVSLASLRPGRGEVEQMLESAAALYVRGAALNWASLHRGEQPVKVALPTYPFQRKRYWVEPDDAETSGGAVGIAASGLGARVDVADGTIVFEQRCSARSHAFLRDHRLSGAILVPGSFYLSLALEACDALGDGVATGVRDVVLSAPLRLAEDETRVIQLVVSAQANGARRFAIHSRGDAACAGAGWTEHASGELAPVAQETGAPPFAADDDALVGQLSGDALRAQFAQRGLVYGGSFQALADVRHGARRAEATLVDQGTTNGLAVHPGLLDAALQTTAACLVYQQRDGAFVPLAFDEVVLSRDARPFAASRVAVWLDRDSDAQPDTIRATLRLFSDDDAPVMEVRGMTLRRLAQPALDAAPEGAEPTEHAIEWTPVDAAVGSEDPAGVWLFVGTPARCAALEARFARGGAGVTLMRLDEAAGRDEIAAALREAPGPLRGALRVVPELDVAAGSTAIAGVAARVGALAGVLAAAPLAPKFKLWLVTAGAWSPADDPEPGVPAAGAIAALGRTLAIEYPDLRCTNVDLARGLPDDAAADALWPELWRADGETDVCLRARRYALRLRVAAGDDRLALPSAASYRLAAAADGRLESLALVACETPQPGRGEVAIAVRAAGLNFRDVLRVLGKLPVSASGIGGELSGVVTAIGEGVTTLRVGDRVMAMADGSFASHAVVDARYVARMPDDWSFDAAATVPVAFLTAHYALTTLGGLARGQRILIHAAATGVGLAAVQLAQRMGLQVFATASAGKRSMLERLGVEHRFDSRSLGFADEILTRTGGQGVDAVLNALTGDFIPESLRALGPSGVFLEMGKAEIWQPERVAAYRPGARYLPFDIADVPGERIEALFGELQAMFARGELQPLPRTLHPLHGARTAFRTMAQGRHVGKVVLRIADDDADALPAGATYLVTGASGALGRDAAQWLVERGARHLMLASRTRSAALDALLERLSARGVRCGWMPADVGIEADVDSVFAALADGWPPLRGVLHAAGTLDDAPLSALDEPRYVRVIAPKADGARLIHERTARAPLDFFVVYSSIASALGSAGQGNYAAANGYLDALVQYRRRLGLPGLAVNWGGWSGAGMAGSMEAAALGRLRAQGQLLLKPASGMASLARLLNAPDSQVAVIAADWAKVAQVRAVRPSLLADVGNSAAAPLPAAAMPGRDVDPRTLVEQAVRKVTGTRSSTRLDVQMSLRDLGLDSLMAMELRNELCALTGRRLAPTIAFDYPSIEALAAHLAALADESGKTVAAAASAPAARRDEQAEAAPAERTELSADELVARLEREISALEGHL